MKISSDTAKPRRTTKCLFFRIRPNINRKVCNYKRSSGFYSDLMKNSESSHRPSTAASSAGLAKYRALQVSEASVESKSRKNLPDGWYFNESKQDEFWKDLEIAAIDKLVEEIHDKCL